MVRLPCAVVGVACALLGGVADAAPFKLQTNVSTVVTRTDREACTAQPALPWCVSDGQARSERSWSANEVSEFQRKVVSGFSYSYRPLDGWRSSYDQATSGQRWSAECDGMTFTVLDGLAREGFPKSKMWRAIVMPTKGVGMVQHMVGIVEVDGQYLVVGDTNRDGVYQLGRAEFSPILISQVSEGSFWRRAVQGSTLVTRATAD